MINLTNDLAQLLLDGGTAVFASRQRAHAARLAFAAARLQAGARVWTTPDILTPEAWLIRELERIAKRPGARLPRVLSPPEEWLLWRQCTQEVTRDLDLLNRGSLAESLRRSSALAAEYAIDLSNVGLVGAEAELFGRIQQAVNERCRAAGAAAIETLAGEAIAARRADHHQSSGMSGRSSDVICAGFLKLAPRLELLGVQHRRSGVARAHPTAVVAADEADEMASIARWCRQRIAKQADTRLLVILPGSAGARERLATLVRQAVDPEGWLSSVEGSSVDNLVAIEGGASLAGWPVIAHALLTLKWLDGTSGDFDEVSEWLRAPYWQAPEATERARLDLWLRESGQMSLDGRRWSAILTKAPAPIGQGTRELAEQMNRAMAALGEGLASPRQWSERFRAALDAVHWPGAQLRSSHEQQTVVRFHELLDEFGQLASSTREMSRHDAIHWFDELAARTAFRPADDDPVVTISSSLADPVVVYDGIWVAGLHAEAFPQPVQPDPFLPLAAQIEAGIPAASADGRLREARALLAAWRAATRELVLSTPARTQDLELLPSPLLAEWFGLVSAAPPASSAKRTCRDSAQIGLFDADTSRPQLWSVEREPKEIVSVEARSPVWLPELMHRPNMVEYIQDIVGEPWPQGQLLPAGTRSLELQNLCGFRAYAELRLGSAKLGAPEPGVAPDVRGQLLHTSLENLWHELRDSDALARQSDESLDSLIEQSVDRAAEAILGVCHDERAPVFMRECRRICRLVKRLCALERTRDRFQVYDTEFEKILEVAGAQMRVRIDRLDILEGGDRAILDYKSGRRTTADWYGERPSHPQLLAYLAAIGEGVAAMATVNVTAREVRFDGIASSGQLLPKVRGVAPPAGHPTADAWQIRVREWKACIERLASAFLTGQALLNPKPGACDWCHAVGVCRISDRGIEAAAELLPVEFDGPAR